MNHRPAKVITRSLLLVALVTAASACGSSDTDAGDTGGTTTSASTVSTTTAPDEASAGELVGTFEIAEGVCADGEVTEGSSFRMVQSGGTPDAGPFVANADSACGDKTYTSLVPGTDGGLITGDYQPQPDPPFDDTKNGLADSILEPATFFAVGFAASTNPEDPESGAKVLAPSISVDADGNLTGDVAAVSVAWNGQQFNQGAPKPDGSKPGATTELSGTYDAETGAYVLEWASQIVGGPFDGFTGLWHLEGTFTAS